MTTKPIKASKGYIGIGMEGPIATWYANSARKNTSDQQKAAKEIAAQMPAGSSILEVAPGPGDLAIALAKRGYKVTGLDISKTFVEIENQKAAEAGLQIDFRLGNASEMPFGDNLFDQIVCQAAFKNFSEPIGALNEMHRVLKPGGKVVIYDLRGDATEAEIDKEIDGMGLNVINRFMVWFTFKFMLLKRAYTTADFEEMVYESVFKQCEIHKDSISVAVWLKK